MVMTYVDSLRNTVYIMPSNLIFIFMSFVILACVMKGFNNCRISYLKLDNVLISCLASLFLITGLQKSILQKLTQQYE